MSRSYIETNSIDSTQNLADYMITRMDIPANYVDSYVRAIPPTRSLSVPSPFGANSKKGMATTIPNANKKSIMIGAPVLVIPSDKQEAPMINRVVRDWTFDDLKSTKLALGYDYINNLEIDWTVCFRFEAKNGRYDIGVVSDAFLYSPAYYIDVHGNILSKIVYVVGTYLTKSGKASKTPAVYAMTYTFDIQKLACTCPGFRYRKTCKHTTALQEQYKLYPPTRPGNI